MGELTELQRSVVERIRAKRTDVASRGARARSRTPLGLYNESRSSSRKAAAMHLIGDVRLVECARVYGITSQAVYQAARVLRGRKQRAVRVEVER